MITAFSGVLIEDIRALVEPRLVWASLHTEEPDFSGSSSSEYFGPGYTRAAVAWQRAGDGVSVNIEPIIWRGLVPVTTIQAIGFLATERGYEIQAYAVLPSPVVVVGETWSLPAGAVTMRVA